MSADLLLTVGVSLLTCGAFFQIWEEWPSRGLTDTSIGSLLCLVTGPAVLAYLAYDAQMLALLGVTACATVVSLVLLYWKLRDHARNRFRLTRRGRR